MSRGLLSTILLTGAGISYSLVASKPLLLENDDAFEMISASEVEQKYLSPVLPFTIEQANEALRWEESIQIVGQGSGVLRFDTNRIPSNNPCEDEVLSASGHEEDEVKWFLWGVFDGHA